jgi:hypothetical protein
MLFYLERAYLKPLLGLKLINREQGKAMKQAMTGLILAISFLVPLVNTGAKAEMGFIGSIGIPRGYMDLSVNGSWFTKMNLSFPVVPELMLTESFSTKGDGGGGRLSMNVLSGYLLGRYTIVSPEHKFSPFVAVGPGVHFMYSFSSKGSALGDTSKAILLGKAHLFFGFDFDLTSKWFFTAQARLTYPSDIILDSGYLGLGMKLR